MTLPVSVLEELEASASKAYRLRDEMQTFALVATFNRTPMIIVLAVGRSALLLAAQHDRITSVDPRSEVPQSVSKSLSQFVSTGTVGAVGNHTLHDPVRDALQELVALKDIKDRFGQTDDYLKRQPVAWQRAREALAETAPESEKNRT